MIKTDMAKYTGPSPICPSTPNLQQFWDSTSMGEFKTCPRKYQLRILEGWQPRSVSVHLTFGIAFHSALEHYDHALSAGRSRDEAIRAAVRQALRITWDAKLKRPWMSQDPNKNRENLLRTVVWYLDHFANDPIETVQLSNGKPAVELSFRIALMYETPADGPYLYCGHIDKIGRLQGKNYILDRKTTKHTLDTKYFAQYSPHNQFTGYMFAGQQAFDEPLSGLICDAAQVLVSGSRFWREPIPRTPEEIEEWLRGLGYWLRMAEFYAKENYWPMNEQSCSNYGGCDFRGICNKAPSAREQWLKASFEKRLWNPLEVRGDI